MMTDESDTRVLYNAECPVCSFEIDHYRDYATARALPIRFDDLNGPERAAWGLSEDAAARRLYVLKDGTLNSGVDAFLVLWRQMPRYRWLARAVAVPGVRHAASALYDYVLAPLIYRWHLRRKARARA